MNKLKFLGVAAIFLAVISSFRLLTPEEVVTSPIRKSFTVNVTDPPCIQVYSCIEFYADSFNIPRKYAYGIASLETGYKGPFHWKYKNTQISSYRSFRTYASFKINCTLGKQRSSI
jgi:hypothetical protein